MTTRKAKQPATTTYLFVISSMKILPPGILRKRLTESCLLLSYMPLQ